MSGDSEGVKVLCTTVLYTCTCVCVCVCHFSLGGSAYRMIVVHVVATLKCPLMVKLYIVHYVCVCVCTLSLSPFSFSLSCFVLSLTPLVVWVSVCTLHYVSLKFDQLHTTSECLTLSLSSHKHTHTHQL